MAIFGLIVTALWFLALGLWAWARRDYADSVGLFVVTALNGTVALIGVHSLGT